MQISKRSSTHTFDDNSPEKRREHLLGNTGRGFSQRSWSLPIGSSGFAPDKYSEFVGQLAGAANNGKLFRKASVFMEEGELMTTRDTAITLANQIVGAGMLALPYAMQQAGFAFVFVLVGVAALMGFTMWLIGDILESVENAAIEMSLPRISRDWSLIGQLAFGERGRRAFALCCMLDLYGALISFMLMIGVNLRILLPSVPATLLIVSTGVLVFLLLFAPERYFAVFASVGLLAQILIFACLLATGAELKAQGTLAEDVVLLDLGGLPAALGIAIFLFVAHSEAPLLYQMMEDRSEWHRAVKQGMLVSLVVFLAVGIVGYLVFGGAVEQSFTANLGRDLHLKPLPGHFNMLFSWACAGLIALKLVISQPFTAAPLIKFVEDSAGLQKSPCARFAWKACFMATTTVLCITLQNSMAFVMEVLGCVVQNAICIILPCLAALQLKGEGMHYLWRCMLRVVVIIFTAYMAVGLKASLAHA